MRRVFGKTIEEIISEWDSLAEIRFNQIISGIDITFNNILAPSIIDLARHERSDTVVDAGCGVGVLTNMLTTFCKSVIGIDPSAASIEIARSRFGSSCKFVNSTLEQYHGDGGMRADIVFANMVLMDVLDIDSFLGAAAAVVNDNGVLIFTIVHPCFWPAYYGYENEAWFDYGIEAVVEGQFKITAQPNCGLVSTHVHRSLERYVIAFYKAGFVLEVLQEPMPSEEIGRLYPTQWRHPRYIVGKCRKLSIAIG
jgi:2-polyprenyl-3-methyl-5-hydroxy-6-metoxy-1,4-benzoquinol methylase